MNDSRPLFRLYFRSKSLEILFLRDLGPGKGVGSRYQDTGQISYWKRLPTPFPGPTGGGLRCAAELVSGETFPPHNFGTYGGVSHKRYNELVREQLKEFMKIEGISAEKKMTTEQMQLFIERMRDGKLCNGKKPGRWSKFRDIGKFNEAIKAERIVFEKTSRTPQGYFLHIGGKHERGKWYRGFSGRFASAALLALIGEALGMANSIANAAGSDKQPNYYWLAVESLAKGDLEGANKYMVGGPTEGGFGGLVGYLSDNGDTHAALALKKWWDDVYKEYSEKGRKAAQTP